MFSKIPGFHSFHSPCNIKIFKQAVSLPLYIILFREELWVNVWLCKLVYYNGRTLPSYLSFESDSSFWTSTSCFLRLPNEDANLDEPSDLMFRFPGPISVSAPPPTVPSIVWLYFKKSVSIRSVENTENHHLLNAQYKDQHTIRHFYRCFRTRAPFS